MSKLNILFEVSLFCSLGLVIYGILSTSISVISSIFLSKTNYYGHSVFIDGLIPIFSTYVIFFVFILSSQKMLTAGE